MSENVDRYMAERDTVVENAVKKLKAAKEEAFQDLINLHTKYCDTPPALKKNCMRQFLMVMTLTLQNDLAAVPDCVEAYFKENNANLN